MHRAQYPMPPWEARELIRIPFVGADGHSTRLVRRQGSGSDISGRRKGSVPQRNEFPQWQRTPSEAPSVGSARDGYTTGTPRTSPNAPTFSLSRASSSTQESANKQPLQTSFEAPSDRSEVKALPGTMSARTSGDQSRSKSQRASRTKLQGSLHGVEDNTAGFSMKLKTAMKDLFHRSPIDESNFEKIKDRHWTEEDY